MAEKIVDGSYKENIYYLLCNLANIGNRSIVLVAIEEEINRKQAAKEANEKEIIDVNDKLNLAKSLKNTMQDGPGEFSNYVKRFNNNKLLVDYLQALGFKNCLDDYMKAHEDEQKTNKVKNRVDNDVKLLSDRLHKLESEGAVLEGQLKNDLDILNNIERATKDVETLVEASVTGNGSFNRDFVEQTFIPFQNIARTFGIIFPEKFVEDASKAIFFPQDGFDKVVEEFREGKVKEILYSNISDKIDLATINEGEVIREVPINNVSVEGLNVPEVDSDETKDNEEIELTTDVEEPSEEVEEDVQAIEEKVEENVPEETSVEKVENEASFEKDNNDDTSNVADRIIEEMNDEVACLDIVVDGTKNELGLEDAKISEGLRKLIDTTDTKLVENNIETLKALNVKDDTFYYVDGNYSYLTDADLAFKLNYLRGKGVPEKSIVSAVEVHYLDCSLEKIKEDVNALENSEIGFDKRYMAIFKYGVDLFFKALDVLRDNGIEPDDAEIAAYLSILARYSDNIDADTDILKDYGISLLRKNGKFELGVYSKKPADLVQSVDAIIENGEDALLNSTPEVLAMNTITILKRILYAKKVNADYKEGEVYADYIYKPFLFKKEFNNPELEEIGSCRDCNIALEKSLNNDLCSIFIEVLDKFYADDRSYKAVELSDEEKSVFGELKSLLEKEFEAKLVNKNAYEMNGVIVSRNKFERNLSCLVSALLSNGEDLLSEARELLIVAALYNSRRPVGKIIDFPKEAEKKASYLGGMAA